MKILDINEQCKKLGINKMKNAKNHPLSFIHDDQQGGAFVCITGGTGRGKTNVLISEFVLGRVRFDHIYLFVKNPHQPKYQFLLKYLNTIEKKYREEFGCEANMITIKTKIEEIPSVDEIDDTMLNVVVFDDMMVEKRQEIIEEYFIRSRHKNCSCYYLGQDYTRIPPVVRHQCQYFLIFGTSSKTELISLSKAQSLDYDFNEFKHILTEATKDKHSFLLIDRKTDLDILRLRKNFDNVWNEDRNEFEKLPCDFEYENGEWKPVPNID